MPSNFFPPLIDLPVSTSSSVVNAAPYARDYSHFKLPVDALHPSFTPKDFACAPGLTAIPDLALLPHTLPVSRHEITFPLLPAQRSSAPFIVSIPSVNGTSEFVSAGEPSSSKRSRTRTRTACDSCRKRKTQCDGAQPCQKCQHYQRPCVYEAAAKEASSTRASHGSRGYHGVIRNRVVSGEPLPRAHLSCPQPSKTELVLNTGNDRASLSSSNAGAHCSVNSAHSSISATSHATPAFYNAEGDTLSQNSKFESTPNGNICNQPASTGGQNESFAVSSLISGLQDRISNMEHLLVEINLRLSSPSSQNLSGGHHHPNIAEGKPNHLANPLQDCEPSSNGIYHHPHYLECGFEGTTVSHPTNVNSFLSEQCSNLDPSSMDMTAPLREVLAHATHLKRILAPEGPKRCVLSGPRVRMDQAFAQHSLVSVLSAESAAWFRHKIAIDPQVGRPLTNIYVAFTNMVQTMADRWRGLSSSHLPTHPYLSRYSPDLIDNILHSWYAGHPWASFVCPLSSILDVIHQYRQKGAPDQPLYVAEVLLMHVAVALAISNRAPGDCVDPVRYPALAAILDTALHEMKVDCFNTAVAIFNSANQACENVVHLQAVCLMFLYNQSSYIVDLQSGYMLASTMVRFAQQMGYHNFESFDKEGTAQDCETWRRIWWLCSVSAIEIAFDTGKPAILNPQQLSTLSANDMHYLADSLSANPGLNSAEALLTACADSAEAAQMYFAHFRLRLCRIKEEALLELCGPRSRSLPLAVRASIMDHVNSAFVLLAQAMDPAVRPIFLTLPQVVTNDFSPPIESFPAFLVGKAHVQLLAFEFKIAYLSSISFINRIPFFEAHELSTSQAINCGDLALNASRAVMALISCTPILPLWARLMTAQMVQTPLVLYCGILATYVLHPLHPHALIDCRVLIQASMNFFATSKALLPEQWGTLRERFTRQVMADFLSRMMLRILVAEIAVKADHDYCDRIPGLAAHLNECSLIYPDMFKPNSSVQSTINLAFEKKPDSTAGHDGASHIKSPTDTSGVEVGKEVYSGHSQIMVQRSRNGWHENQTNETFDNMLTEMAMDHQMLDLQARQNYGEST